MRLLPGFILKRPYIPEYDLAGVIVDTNGSEFQNGDEVFGFLPVRMLSHQHFHGPFTLSSS